MAKRPFLLNNTCDKGHPITPTVGFCSVCQTFRLGFPNRVILPLMQQPGGPFWHPADWEYPRFEPAARYIIEIGRAARG